MLVDWVSYLCDEHGVLARNLPLLLENYREGQPVSFDLGAVLLWFTFAAH